MTMYHIYNHKNDSFEDLRCSVNFMEHPNGVSGSVVAIDSNRVFKKYHDEVLREHNELLHERIWHQIKNEILVQNIKMSQFPQFSCFAWPHSPVYSEQRTTDEAFVGFVMERRNNFFCLDDVFGGTGKKSNSYRPLSPAHKAACLSGISFVAHKLHSKNVFIGDVNGQNILIDSSTLCPFIVDCDSFQFSSGGKMFYADCGRSEYSSPNLLRTVNGSKSGWLGAKRTLQDEVFSLSVVIFQTLFEGVHPFAYKGKGNSGIKDAILSGKYPHNHKTLSPPQYFSSALSSKLPSNIWKIFHRVFSEPESHNVTMQEWETALRNYGLELQGKPSLKNGPRQSTNEGLWNTDTTIKTSKKPPVSGKKAVPKKPPKPVAPQTPPVQPPPINKINPPAPSLLDKIKDHFDDISGILIWVIIAVLFILWTI